MSDHSLNLKRLQVARPRSEEKQKALLRAAIEIFAEHGLGAPTSAIAKRAGVAEGTLFRYFENKDVLMRAVFDHLLDVSEQLFAESVVKSLPGTSQSQAVWDAYVDWALVNPAANATSNKLMVSGKLSNEQMARGMRLVDIAMEGLPLVQGLDLAHSIEFQNAICTAIGNAVIDISTPRPHLLAVYKRAGYQAMMRAIKTPESSES
ncbi:TetR/AcrR family transcriptional regulator [Pseudomonas sp. WS 5010]|uniref:TetR/AcrR family transcriptional regulator n=1 Tax=Pseudomonas sp. WS 5010 TaxID=2717489 RepID=UPI001CA3F7F8|nr:TetR/AcrR family transcriptional regulator [Pseudomonas sp. WS 5010]